MFPFQDEGKALIDPFRQKILDKGEAEDYNKIRVSVSPLPPFWSGGKGGEAVVLKEETQKKRASFNEKTIRKELRKENGNNYRY